MSWLERVATGASVLRELSSSLSCPVYCGTPIWLPLLLGIFLGLCLGFALAIYFTWTFLLPPQSSGSRRAFPKARHRLSGYLVDE